MWHFVLCQSSWWQWNHYLGFEQKTRDLLSNTESHSHFPQSDCSYIFKYIYIFLKKIHIYIYTQVYLHIEIKTKYMYNHVQTLYTFMCIFTWPISKCEAHENMHMLEYVSGCTPRPVTATTKTVSHFYYTSSLVIASGLWAHPNVAFKQPNTRSNHVQWHNTSFQLNWKEDTKTLMSFQ